jgi:hypothetical protein
MLARVPRRMGRVSYIYKYFIMCTAPDLHRISVGDNCMVVELQPNGLLRVQDVMLALLDCVTKPSTRFANPLLSRPDNV